jgi:hypothetical protein
MSLGEQLAAKATLEKANPNGAPLICASGECRTSERLLNSFSIQGFQDEILNLVSLGLDPENQRTQSLTERPTKQLKVTNS